MRQDLNFKNSYPSSKFKKGTKPLIFKLIDTLKMKIKVLKELSSFSWVRGLRWKVLIFRIKVFKGGL